MKKRITDLFDDMPIEILDETIRKEGSSMHHKYKMSRYPRWGMAAAVTLALMAAGCAGYAAANSNIFNQYFGGKDEKLKQELILEDSYQAQNGNYRMTAESIMADTKVKRILVSVEALNEESCLAMEQKGIFLHINTSSGAGNSVTDCTEMLGEGKQEKKKYYLIETEEAADVCTIVCTEGMDFPEGSTEELEKQGYLVLSCPVKEKVDKGINIAAEDITFLNGAELERVEIHRLSINLFGTGVQSSGAEKCDNHTPEVLAETKDGERICLLADNREALSQDIEQYWRSSGRRVSEYSEDGSVSAYELSYTFVDAFDVDCVQKIWIDGVEFTVE